MIRASSSRVQTRMSRAAGRLVFVTSLTCAAPALAQATDGKPAAAPPAKPSAPATTPAVKPDKAAAAANDKAATKIAAEARTRYAEGEKRLKANDYAGALVEFQAADEAKPSPQAARNIGLCQDKLEHYPEAVAAYERFLADVPLKAQAQAQADEARARVAAIEALPAKLHVDSDPKGASVIADGNPAAAPTPTDLELAPGHHVLKLSAEGRQTVTQEIDVTFASKTDVTLTLPAVAAVPAPPVAVVVAAPADSVPPVVTPPVAETPHSKVPAFVTGGLAVAAAGVGAVFGIVALNDRSDFNANPTSSKADTAENHALVADMAFGIAITLGITSAVLFLSHDDAPAAAAAAPTGGAAPAPAEAEKKSSKGSHMTFAAAPIVTPHGGGAGALIRF